MLPTLLVLIAGVLWSFSGILIKEINCNAFAIAGIRSLIGGTLQFGFLVYLAHRSSSALGPAPADTVLRVSEFNELNKLNQSQSTPEPAFVLVFKRIFVLQPVHWLGAILFVLNMIGLVWAFQLTSAATAVFLHYSGIVLVALFSLPILKQPLTKPDWLAVLVTFAGIALFSIDGLQLNCLPGTALGISCGLTMAATNLCLGLRAKATKSGSEALEMIVLANMLMVLVSLPSIFTTPLPVPGDRAWIFLILLGIVPWGLPDILYSIGIKQVPVFRALILGTSDPILTAVWPLIFLSEIPSKLAICGAVMILGAIIYQAKNALKALPG